MDREPTNVRTMIAWPFVHLTLKSVLVWSLVVVIVTALQVIGRSVTNAPAPYFELLSMSAVIFMPWAFLTPLIMLTVRRVPVTLRLRSIAAHLVSTIAVSLIYYTTLRSFIPLNAGNYSGREPIGAVTQWGAFFLPWNAVLHWIIGVLTVLLDRSRQAARMKALLSEARLVALRSQLHPHFLFNTLHGIASCIRFGERGRAVDMITRLGDLLRRMLNATESSSYALDEELGFMNEYLGIEQQRLGARLSVSIDVTSEARRAQVPPLILQPIVENAIKHGIAPSADPGTVRIAGAVECERLRLSVSNGGEPLGPTSDHHGGRGLAIVRARLDEIHGEDHTFRMNTADGETRATLEIPYMAAEPKE